MINSEMIQDDGWNIDYKKAEMIQRNNIIVVSSSLENIEAENTRMFIRMLNSYYSEQVGDVAPYHYYVDTDGIIYSSKHDVLKVNPTSELKSFEEDIIIMVINKDITVMSSEQKSSLVNLIIELSNNYEIPSSNIGFYPESYIYYNAAKSIINDLIMQVIDGRNSIEKLNFICENTDNDMPSISNKVGLIRTHEDCYTFRDLGLRFGVDELTLKSMNPHITTLTPGQIVFYPKTIITNSIDTIDYFKKHGDKYYNLSKIKIKE